MIDSSLPFKRTKGRVDPPSLHRTVSGPPSLRDAALRMCAWNIHSPGMAETLTDYSEHVGWPVIKPLYEYMAQR